MGRMGEIKDGRMGGIKDGEEVGRSWAESDGVFVDSESTSIRLRGRLWFSW